MTASLLIDAVLIGLLSVFALKGMKMGLVLAVASAITLVIALLGANFVTDNYAHYVVGPFEPMVAAWVDNEAGLDIDFDSVSMPEFSLKDSLKELGLSEKLANDVANGVSTQIDRAETNIKAAVSESMAMVVARCFTYIISFIALTLLLYTAATLLDNVAKLPILNLVNKLGGLAGGAATGAIILYIAIGAFNFLGFIGPNIYEGTYLLKMYMNFMEGR